MEERDKEKQMGKETGERAGRRQRESNSHKRLEKGGGMRAAWGQHTAAAAGSRKPPENGTKDHRHSEPSRGASSPEADVSLPAPVFSYTR